MKNILEAKGLKKRFLTGKRYYEAVKGVDLEVKEGEIFGFLGPNGAGKTTTLRMLTTLLPIEEGEAYIGGYGLKEKPHEVRKCIGFVSQQGGADPGATGYENLFLQARLYGYGYAEARAIVDRLVAIFSLQECVDRFVSSYSGGQERRMDIALGMVHKPRILFLDEPTAGLDIQNRSALWEQIRLLKQEGTTVFITSHYLEEIDFLADRVAIIDGGKIVANGSLMELKREMLGDLVHLHVGDGDVERAVAVLKGKDFVKEVKVIENAIKINVTKGDADTIKILKLLDVEAIPIVSIRLTVPTLDDLFLEKTGHSLRE